MNCSGLFAVFLSGLGPEFYSSILYRNAYELNWNGMRYDVMISVNRLGLKGRETFAVLVF